MAVIYPQVLRRLNLFVDGRGYAGRVKEVVLPKLTIKTEEWRAGAMDAPVEIDVGMEKLELGIKLGEISPDILRNFGLLNSTDLPVTLRSATRRQGQPNAQSVVLNLLGGWRELDMGTWTAGSLAECDIACALTYYKLTIDNQELIEIDVLNVVRKINGVDQLESERAAIGL